MAYKGMTVNERLYHAGIIKEFDNAVKSRNVEKATELLEKVELSSDSIIFILEELELILKSRSDKTSK